MAIEPLGEIWDCCRVADPWSWKTVFETLLGTAVGAGIGIGGIRWQVRREKQERYETLLNEKFADVVTYVISLTGRVGHTQKQLVGDMTSLFFQLSNIQMHAKGVDQRLISKLAACCDWEKCLGETATTNPSDPAPPAVTKKFMDFFGWLMEIAINWRVGYFSREEVEVLIQEKITELGIVHRPKKVASISTWKVIRRYERKFAGRKSI